MVQSGDQRAAKDSQDEAEQALVQLREVERVGCEEGEERCDVCRGEEADEEDSEEPSESEQPSDVEIGAGESGDEESEREEARITLKQQQRERQGPRQTMIQQQQHEFADVEWLRRQLAHWTNRCATCEAAGESQSNHDIVTAMLACREHGD
ncbi:hypothetical protein HBI12_240860 [Parastagonospora nodorum]|nr:hypothetical protein HBI12_240860 [Parastagonospora nodorum]KAH5395091.1 hypothetical protein HBI47_235350 [Parastagonospora nodorum]